jgi:hypothetical protein
VKPGLERLKQRRPFADAPCMTSLRRFFRRAADPDRSSWRAGQDASPAVLVSPRVWVALG